MFVCFFFFMWELWDLHGLLIRRHAVYQHHVWCPSPTVYACISNSDPQDNISDK